MRNAINVEALRRIIESVDLEVELLHFREQMEMYNVSGYIVSGQGSAVVLET